MEYIYTTVSDRLLTEARMEVLALVDPLERLDALCAMIAAGDEELAPVAIEVLRSVPSDEEISQGSASDSVEYGSLTSESFIAKGAKATLLVQALASRQLFEEADSVFTVIEPGNKKAAVECMSALLREGYTGPDDKYLTADLTEHAETEPNAEPPSEIFE